MQETLTHIRTKYPVSDRVLRRFLNEKGINRGVSGAQKLKRFDCSCQICMKPFKGRTPTAMMCDTCVGEDAVGVTKKRLKKYQYFKRMQSYGIDVQTYDVMLEQQAGLCGLCSCNLKNLTTNLVHLDHCHVTGCVRGILCQFCNNALGVVEKRGGQVWLQKAQNWLQKDKS